MIKYVIASHSGFANGLKSTLNFLTNNSKKIISITAYDDQQITDLALDNIDSIVDDSLKTKIIFMTDINSGSVAQKIVPLVLNKPNVFLITGVNVPLGLSILLTDEKDISEEKLTQLCTDQQAQPQLITKQYLAYQEDSGDE